jgi:hypothetical protein
MEHQVPQFPELITDFRVTQRHRGGLPVRGESAPNADSVFEVLSEPTVMHDAHINY